jgi:hypothetical protein
VRIGLQVQLRYTEQEARPPREPHGTMKQHPSLSLHAWLEDLTKVVIVSGCVMIYDEYLVGRKAFRCNKEIGPENSGKKLTVLGRQPRVLEAH